MAELNSLNNGSFITNLIINDCIGSNADANAVFNFCAVFIKYRCKVFNSSSAFPFIRRLPNAFTMFVDVYEREIFLQIYGKFAVECDRNGKISKKFRNLVFLL